MKIRNGVLVFLGLFFGFSGNAEAASIRDVGSHIRVQGENYRIDFEKKSGAIVSLAIDGEETTVHSGASGLWYAKFADQSTADARSSGEPQIALEPQKLSFLYRNPKLDVVVSVIPEKRQLDFRLAASPTQSPVIELGGPGRLLFSPEQLQDAVTHIPRPNNVGVRLNRSFFQRRDDGVFRRGREVQSRAYRVIFGSGAQILPDKKQGKLNPGKDAPEWLGADGIARSKELLLKADRPFAPGQAEIELMTDPENGNVVWGGSRLGGSGALFRLGGSASGPRSDQVVGELILKVIEKIRTEKRSGGERRKIALIRVSGGYSRPDGSVWQRLLSPYENDLLVISSRKELAAAIDDPAVAAIINPYGEVCLTPPGESLEQFALRIKDFVRRGGYWFETFGYSFYFEFAVREYLTTGRNGSPNAMADFTHLRFQRGGVSVYTVQPLTWQPFDGRKNPQHIFKPSLLEVGATADGGFLDRAYLTYIKPGEWGALPVSRYLFEADAAAGLRQFCTDNQVTKKLKEKGSPELFAKTARSVIYHPNIHSPQGERARNLIDSLPHLPSPILIHPSTYIKHGHDKGYPDHLPPRAAWGTPEELEELIQAIKARGMLFMPYMNNTWWCDNPRGETFARVGTEALQRLLDGTHFAEKYGRNEGWRICFWHPEVRKANEKILEDFTRNYPADILFQDQTGARGAMLGPQVLGYDLNPASPSPEALIEGLVSTVRADAQSAVLGSEEVWWGILNSEFLVSGLNFGLIPFESHTPLKYLYPTDSWSIYPMLQVMAHDKVFLYHHDLGGDVSSPELVSWTLALGYNMVTIAHPASLRIRKWENTEQYLEWLRWIDRVQKSVCAQYAGSGVSAFLHQWGDWKDDGVIRSVFGPVSVVANLQRKPLAEGIFEISPKGFIAHGNGVTAGDVLAVAGVRGAKSMFVVEGDKVYLYARPGSICAIPLHRLPPDKIVLKGGGALNFRVEKQAVLITLPQEGAGWKFWELELK